MSDDEIKKLDIKKFLEEGASALNTIRSIIIFGRNESTYKFILCHALMKQEPTNSLSYDDLTVGSRARDI